MRRALRAGLLVASVVVAAFVGCGPNDDLGFDAGGASSSAKAASASSSSAGGSASSSTSTTASASSSSGAGGGEPNLPTALTVVNGVTDYDAVRFCFLPDQTPWPAAAAGLPFATGQVVDLSTLPAGVDLTTWVFSGDVQATAGMTCSQLLALAASEVPDAGPSDAGPGTGGAAGAGGAGGAGAGGSSTTDAGTTDAGTGGVAPTDAGPDDAGASDAGGPGDAGSTDAGPLLVAAEIGTIPASVLTSQRSLLFVATGCMGGPGHDNPSASIACGAGYTSATPTAAAVLAGMSRIGSASHPSLQVVSASPALAPTDMYVLPNMAGAAPIEIAPALTQGAIGPIPPYDGLTLAAYGPLGPVELQTHAANTTSVTSTTTFAQIFAGGGSVGMADFVNGAVLVFVAVGATPGAQGGPFWHPLSYALVKANPG